LTVASKIAEPDATAGSRGSREVLSPRSAAAASTWSTRYTRSGVKYAAGPACSFNALFSEHEPDQRLAVPGVHLDHQVTLSPLVEPAHPASTETEQPSHLDG